MLNYILHYILNNILNYILHYILHYIDNEYGGDSLVACITGAKQCGEC